MAEDLGRGPAIVLRRYPLGESDRMVIMLTRSWGKVRAVAKGMRRSRKRGLSSLDVLSLAQVELTKTKRGRGWRISAGKVIDPFWPLAKDPVGLAMAFCFTETIDRMVGVDHPVPEIFDLLNWALGALSRGGGENVLRMAEVKLLDLSGLLPPLDRCPKCGNDPLGRGADKGARFSFTAQAAYCGRCAGSNATNPTLSDGTLRTLRQIAGQPVERLSRLSLTRTSVDELGAIMPKLIEYHLGDRIKSRRVLSQLLPNRPAKARGAAGP